MNCTGYRYYLERQRHDLALRMIRHGARTCTIRACTGLSEDRIRRLYKTFAAEHEALAARRRRGKSPRQTAFFTRSTRLQYESSLLAAVLTAFGLLSSAPPRPGRPWQAFSVGFAERFCDAYETHLQLVASSRISFEHAWFLLQLLHSDSGLALTRCRRCDTRYVRDATDPLHRACPTCKLQALPARRCAPERSPVPLRA